MDKMIGKMLDNRYELLEVIGSGGMAVVYKAKCHRLNRLVAVKVLKSDLAEDADFRRRFRDESQAVAMLSHPNIVSVYDVSRGETEYIVMELIEGITLKQYMEKRGQLNWREGLHFVTQIMRGLRHAHSRGIVHRDIKPQNIMVLRDGSVKVADFGIACLSNSGETLTQEALGSVHYISPEQAKGDRIDARSDIYSAGVVLYELLTNRLPFEGDSAVSVAIQHLSSVPLSPREINPEVPEALELICMKAMACDIEKRYASADEMLADLEEFRKNPDVDLDFTIEDLQREESTEPTQYIPAVQAVGSRTDGSVQTDEYEDPESSEKKRKTMIIAGGLLAAAAMVFVLFHFIFGSFETQTPTEFVVPSLLGKTMEEVMADTSITSVFTVEQIGQRASSDYPAGQILEQTPESGKVVKGERNISVFVSTGIRMEPMPNLVGQEYRAAKIQLKNLDLDLVFEDAEWYSDSVTSGCIIKTEPAFGEMVQSGDTIKLYISKGVEAKPVAVPTCTGFAIETVRQNLTQLGLVCGEVSYDETSPVPYGVVIWQSVAANETVDSGTTINLTVSGNQAASEEPAVAP